MKQEDLATFSDVLFYLERRGIEPENARDIVMQVFNWGVSACMDRMRQARPSPPDAPEPIEQLSLIAEPEKPKGKKEPKKVKRRWPPEFVLTDTLRSFAVVRGFTPTEIENMWIKFHNAALRDGTEWVDWDAAWRTWVMRGVEYKNRDNQNRKPDHIDGRL